MKKPSRFLIALAVSSIVFGGNFARADIRLDDKVFEFYNAPGSVSDMAISDDGSILWAATSIGVEKRDAKTGQVLGLHGGFPRGVRLSILTDGAAGLWVVAYGLYHLKSDGSRKVFSDDDVGLNFSRVAAIFRDGAGGLYVVTDAGAAHLKPDGSRERLNDHGIGHRDDLAIPDGNGGFWASNITHQYLLMVISSGLIHLKSDGSRDTFTVGNSPLPSNYIHALLSDGSGGAWVGTQAGLARLKSDGSWEIHGGDEARLPASRVENLVHDGFGGLWIWFPDIGLAHLKTDGSSEMFTSSDSGAPPGGTHSSRLLLDGAGGLWIAADYRDSVYTSPSYHREWSSGLTHLKADGSWETFTTDNSNLPDNHISAFVHDGSDGLWLGMSDGVLRMRAGSFIKTPHPYYDDLPDQFNCLLGDGAGGLWLGTDNGLNHLKSDNSPRLLTPDNSDLPCPVVDQLHKDDEGGLWMTCRDSPDDAHVLAHLKSDASWDVFTAENSSLPYTSIGKMLNDGAGGSWITAENGPYDPTAARIGLAHLNSDASWELFYLTDPQWPPANNPVFGYSRIRLLAHDGVGGTWFWASALSHLAPDGSWEIFGMVDDRFKQEYVNMLLGDDGGGAWIVSNRSLVHVKPEGSFKTFPLQDYFPDYGGYADSLETHGDAVKDGAGGLWIAAMHIHREPPPSYGLQVDYSLCHLKSDDSFEVFTPDNSKLDKSGARSLLADSRGGLWIGASGLSLTHVSPDGVWNVVSTNRNRAYGSVANLRGDDVGGLWFEPAPGRTARLSFNKITEIANSIEDEEIREELLHGSRAAIVLAAGFLSPSDDPLWFGAQHLAGLVYKTLWDRGYNHSEIYLASPSTWMDFNGDGYTDAIVDAPSASQESANGAGGRALTLDDVRIAFQWARSKGPLTQPLYIHLVGPGAPPGRLMLNPSEALGGVELSALLDEYQAETGNTVFIAIESSYSGGFIPWLSDANRVVATSSGPGETSFYDRNGRMSFTRAFLEPMARGEHVNTAMELARETMKSAYGATAVSPLLDYFGNGAVGATAISPLLDYFGNDAGGAASGGGIHLNGAWKTEGRLIVVTPVEQEKAIVAGETFTLDVKITSDGPIKDAWAVVRPPYPAIVHDDYGTPVMNNPSIVLHDPDGDGTYTGVFNDFKPAGDYLVTFFASNFNHLQAIPAAMTVTASHPADKPIWLTVDDDMNFVLPCVVKNGVGYRASFDSYTASGLADGLYWKVDSATIHETENENCIPFQPDLSLPVRHAQYEGQVYRFTLDFFPNPADPENNFLYWSLDGSSLTAE